MIVTELRGNIRDAGEGARVADRVVFDNESRLKRIQRVTTAGGVEMGLQLDKSVRELEDGDILAETENGYVIAEMAPLDVLAIAPKTIEEALEVAHSLGNRHLQAQFFGKDSQFNAEVMVVRYDHTVEHHLDHMSVDYHRGDYVMPKAFRHAEHTH